MAKTESFDVLRRDWEQDPEFRQEYAALELEAQVARVIIAARVGANLTQEQLAERMNTSRTAVARMEGGRHLPSLSTLQRVARATGRPVKLEVA